MCITNAQNQQSASRIIKVNKLREERLKSTICIKKSNKRQLKVKCVYVITGLHYRMIYSKIQKRKLFKTFQYTKSLVNSTFSPYLYFFGHLEYTFFDAIYCSKPNASNNLSNTYMICFIYFARRRLQLEHHLEHARNICHSTFKQSSINQST